MADEISGLLKNGSETIVRTWTEKVISDKRVRSEARLTYAQLVDHVPQIVEELRLALANDTPEDVISGKGKEHGRLRWQQGYELKEVVRELMLLRATVLEFVDTYGGAMHPQTPEQLSHCYRKINGFLDEELYRTVEAYLDAPRDPRLAEEFIA